MGLGLWVRAKVRGRVGVRVRAAANSLAHTPTNTPTDAWCPAPPPRLSLAFVWPAPCSAWLGVGVG